MGDTKIQWTGKTWNPIRARNKVTGEVGWFCEHVSHGCDNCYAEKMNINTYFGNGLEYKASNLPQLELFLDEKILEQPLRWRKPTMIFPCSMTDLFGRFVKDEWIDRMFAVMALAPQHTFQVLTKRPERMSDYVSSRFVENQTHLSDAACWASESANALAYAATKRTDQNSNDGVYEMLWGALDYRGYFPNVWLGVSVEDQQTADERIPMLMGIPAAVRWISAEPLLAPIDFQAPWSAINPEYPEPGIHWVVVGGESGKKARPFGVRWARAILRQCKQASVPAFVKQLGARPFAGFCTCGRTGQVNCYVCGGFYQFKDKKGGDINEWPKDLRVREFPIAA